MPDYSPTLRDMAARLDHIDQQIKSIHDKPAMRLTPLTLAAESYDASRSFGAEDRRSVRQAREELANWLPMNHAIRAMGIPKIRFLPK